jgi:hypothetical protein
MIAIIGENMTVELPDDVQIQTELIPGNVTYRIAYPPSKPNLGLATTAELLDEIRERGRAMK